VADFDARCDCRLLLVPPLFTVFDRYNGAFGKRLFGRAHHTHGVLIYTGLPEFAKNLLTAVYNKHTIIV